MVNKLAPLITEGTKTEAKKFQEQYGGEIFTGRHEAWVTVANGKRRGLFWNPNGEGKRVRAETYKLAEQFNISLSLHPDITPGKISTIFWKDIIGINPKLDRKAGKQSGYYGVGWNNLAKRKSQPDVETGNEEEFDHWHFQLWREHEPQLLVDRDIKSAFGNALVSAPTLFLYEHKNGTSTFIDDGGAMKRLREWFPHLPKWFKHRMVGTLASHQYGIKWGAAFNTSQWAILNVYKAMLGATEIAGDYCVRAFVDCVTLKGSTPLEVIEAVEGYLARQGFELGTKALGYGQLWSPVEGFIGYKNVIGIESDVQSEMIKRKIDIKKTAAAFDNEMVKNFGTRLLTHVMKTGDREIYGHYNKLGFYSICQSVTGASERPWYQVYPMLPDKASKYLTKL